ncbi:ubiquitinyl hydrolase 1 [Marasmius tenuissimus]|uniref:Ubiquitin carboxyl-terminal hydrolase n=1 Tax=Marasmius tenuissimus TaxID=585030 RepID=A0ABR2ZLG6_9AGAR
MASTTTGSGLSWIPLESNPEVFNGWAQQAGLDISKDSYNDIYSLDPEMLASIPRPVKAVIVVFPYRERRGTRDAEDARQQEGGNSNLHEKVFWMKQRIRDACGAMAIVHSLANTPVTLTPDSPLSLFYNSARGKAPLERSALFETTPEFATIHSSVTTIGQCNLPDNDEEVEAGYIAFVPYQGDGGEMKIAELDGARAGPVERGTFNEGEDLLDAALRILKEDFIGKSGSIKFNVMYLGKPVAE